MKLMRIGPVGQERTAVLVGDGVYVDVSDQEPAYDEAFFASGRIADLRGVVLERVANGDVHEIGAQRIGSPIARPHQVLCIGLNYSDHAEETGQAIPDEPILFTKSPNTVIGPDDTVLVPRGSSKTDWKCSSVSTSDSLAP